MTELADGDPGKPGGFGRLIASGWYVCIGSLFDRIGRTREAEKSYRHALEWHPGAFSALSGLGRLLLRAGRFDEAVSIWTGIIERSPGSAALAFQFSRALHRSGRLRQAADEYLRVVSIEPLHEKALGALEQLGVSSARADLDHARSIGRRLLEVGAGSQRCVMAATAIAHALSAEGAQRLEKDPEAALARFMAALELSPDLFEAQRGAAICLELTGQPERAIALLDRQIEANPGLLEPQLQRDRISTALQRAPGHDLALAAGRGRLIALQREERTARERARALSAERERLRDSVRDQANAAERRRLEALEQEEQAAIERARLLVAERARLLSGEGAQAAQLDRERLLAAERTTLLARARALAAGKTQDGDDGGETTRHTLQELLQAAQAAANENRLAEAETLFREALDRNGEDVRALTGLAQIYRSQRRWSEAIEILNAWITHRPSALQPRRWLANVLLQDDRLEAAAAAYADLSVLEPKSAEVWQSLAQVEKRLARWPAARAAWARVVELSPDRTGPRFELAMACQQAGDLAAAQSQLQDILAIEPGHQPALTQLGRMSLAGEPGASLEWWMRLATLDPAALEPKLQTARLLLRLERLDEAETAFRAVLEQRPSHPEAAAALARIVFDRDPAASAEIFERWAQREPGSAAPWLGLARVQENAGRIETAEAAYRKALDIEPSNVEALTRLGRLLGTADRQDEALELWTRLSELSPGSVESRLQAATIHYTRHSPRAEEALRAVLTLDPDNRQALRQLAQFLGRTTDRIGEALEVWQRLADLDTGAVVPIVQRARLLDRVGRVDEAEADYRKALERDPQHHMVLADAARFYRLRQRWDEAASFYRALLDLAPNRLDAVLGLGQCCDRTDRMEEAKELYDRALSLDPSNVTALGYRGRLLRALGQVNDALSDFRRICDLQPQNASAWHELVYQLAGAEREPEALEALAQAEAALGPSPQSWSLLGRAAEAALFDRQAVSYFEKAIEAEPENAAHRAQLGLYFLRQGILDGAFHHLADSRDLDPGNEEVAASLAEVVKALDTLGFDASALRQAPRRTGEILTPELLFKQVTDLAKSQVRLYQPVPRSIVAITGSLAPGGAERQLVTMLRGLSAPGFELKLALFCNSLAPRFRRDFFLPVLDGTGVEIVVADGRSAVDDFDDPAVRPFADVIRQFPANMAGSIATWLKEFSQRRPAVVHAWQDSINLTAVVAALLAGVPRIVLCCRSIRPDNPRRRLRRYMQAGYQAVLTHPSVILSNNSRAGANDYADWLAMDPARIEVVYNGIDFERLARSVDPVEATAIRERLGIPPAAPIVGGVFRLIEVKRPLLWLEVAAAVARRHEDVHFLICGDGPMRDEVSDRAAELGIADRLHMPGAQTNIGVWYRMMSVVLLTSRHEGLPNVLLEAQSLGIPVVAPNVGGMSEVVEQGLTGWAILDADAESLADQTLSVLEDKSWRERAALRAPIFVRSFFSVEAMLHRNLEVYGIAAEAPSRLAAAK